MQDVLSLILGGGRGARLYPLTRVRSEPAVSIAGKYRLIDIPISNCLNSGLNRVFVLTQFQSVSLHRHLATTYKFDAFGHGFVEVLAAQQTNEATDWYKGTADAVKQNIRYVQEEGVRDVFILSGDQLYRMDFRQMLQQHRESNADATLAVLPVAREQAGSFGIVHPNEEGRLTRFVEKPQTDADLEPLKIAPAWFEQRKIPVRGREFLANMGIYLFRRQALFDFLFAQPSANDFATEIFPRFIPTHRIQSYLFDDYWKDVGTIRSYHEANLALAQDDPPFDFHSPEGVIYTHMRFLPAARICGAHLEQSLVSDGCVVSSGARIERCVLGVRSQIGKNVTLRDTVMLGSDRFETGEERASVEQRGLPQLGVGDSTVIERAILDKHCRIGRNVRILNTGHVQEGEGTNFVIRDGIVVIPRNALIPDGTVI